MKLFLEEFELNRLPRRMQKGDRDAAEKLYAKLSDRVYGFCMNRVGNPHLAEDIMQDIFVKLVEHVEAFERGKGTFSAWFWQLARNTVIDHYRKKRETAFSDMPDGTVEASATHEPHEFLNHKWEYERVRGALKTLDREEQELLELRFVVELSYKEIASVLGKSEGALRVATNRLKSKIRTSLA